MTNRLASSLRKEEGLTAEEQEILTRLPEPGTLFSDEPEMESSQHYDQLRLLVESLERLWRDRQDFFIGANLSVYYSLSQLRKRPFRGPDFFVVKKVQRHPRRSWVVWEEDGRLPDIIIELLSDSTAAVDRTERKDVYARAFHTPEYFWFSPETLELAGFYLRGDNYEPIPPDGRGWLWSDVLDLYLGILEGQLRYFNADAELVLTPSEAADRLAAQLRALGVEPEA
ncbi:MAG: Uma2 family endonuclease [Armatimonadetes bacterium]|nr:Uma2 family endonuclease [Armatimonadota bacterium]